jgi:RNA polymerase sigma-70 factor (family 1)
MPSEIDHKNRNSGKGKRGGIISLNGNTFEKLFHENYASLCRYCLQFVRQTEIAEEIVQDQFIYIWYNRHHATIHTSVQSYLYRAVRNKSIDYLRSRFARVKFEKDISENDPSPWENPFEKLETEELKQLISKAVRDLPEKCYTIFTLSRFGGMKNQEIAESLNISIKTVENQITIALRKIKAFLEKHWMLLLLLLSLIFKGK